MKTFYRLMVTVLISLSLVACATMPKDKEDRPNIQEQERQETPDEGEPNRDQDDDLEDFEEDFEGDTENKLDRDPENKNRLPDLETEVEP